MKKIVPILFMACCAIGAKAQIINPVIQGMFGIDADAQSNMFVVATSPCSDCDDWYYPQIPNGGNSLYVIDTTGAAAIVAGYASNPSANGNTPIYRKMSYPAYTQTNGRTLIDAIFVRDYHGVDQTIFGNTSNKNGMSPANWTGGTGSVQNKDEILDAYCHLRRQGFNYNTSDSLWLFGAVSIFGTGGDRYFDFEMYQTDIFYTRSTQKFTGYGPDAGHTSWKFDAAGNVTQAGDIIFSAYYQSSNLSSIEARIWVDTNTAHNVIPAGFTWTGSFDGASNNSLYGYAGIVPASGDPFYMGTENSGSTWAGPFELPVPGSGGSNAILTNFAPGQFMEFGVNLTTLGLDPVSLMGVTPCGIPFSKVLVKTRSSASFTSSLSDFIGPFDFFLPPQAAVAADVPVFCGSTGVSNISVTNPYSTSTYNWVASGGGNIVGSTTGTTIQVNQPGTYTVTQTLSTGCPTYATASQTITYSSTCTVLASDQIDLKGLLNNGVVNLDWTVTANQNLKYFTIERSTDGIHYTLAGNVDAKNTGSSDAEYNADDEIFGLSAPGVYYRIKAVGTNGDVQYSKVIKISLALNGVSDVTIMPNPVRNVLQINIASKADKDVQVFIYDITGKLMRTTASHVQKGYTSIKMTDFSAWAKGVYTVKVMSGKDAFVNKMVLTK